MTDINDVIEETAREALAKQDTWKACAYGVIKELAATELKFTSFAVVHRLKFLGVQTNDLRALGGVMRKASLDGIIEATGEYLPNTSRHMAPCRVWRGTKAE